MQFYLQKDIYNDLIFLGTSQNLCAYLKDRFHNLYYFTSDKISGKQYKLFLDDGFRRSGKFIYKPFCINCYECQILRIPLHSFKKSKSQRRIWKRLIDRIQYKIQKPLFTIEKLSLYYRYLNIIHKDSFYEDIKDFHKIHHNIMNKLLNKDLELNKEEHFFLEPLKKNYQSFFIETCLENDLTKELLIFENQKLIGVGIFDLADDYWSSVYFFYDPDYSQYSLGNFSVLLEMEIAKQQGFNYYYPGYYIENCDKMNYKKNFRPNEIKRIYEKNFRSFIK
jgi:arginine-tRNA-protein transferase